MEEQFIRDRISKLREQKQVSERKMSLDLGHSTSYIRSITSGRSLPSMSEFLYICEYLGVTPMEFFNEDKATTLMQQKAIDYIYSMSDEDVSLMIGFIERIQNRAKRCEPGFIDFAAVDGRLVDDSELAAFPDRRNVGKRFFHGVTPFSGCAGGKRSGPMSRIK